MKKSRNALFDKLSTEECSVKFHIIMRIAHKLWEQSVFIIKENFICLSNTHIVIKAISGEINYLAEFILC